MPQSQNSAPGFLKYPDYEITIEPVDALMQISSEGTLLGQTRNGIVLRETNHRPVWYVPLTAIKSSFLQKTVTQTYCPFKGYASYDSIHIHESNPATSDPSVRVLKDTVWTYESPFDECEDLLGFASIYTDKVDLRIDGHLVGKEGPGRI